ncbi:MAG TPA: NB-ARC domain-containing protein [Trebonia sp.]|nr:NB-ARC domain-containing protein [Trebonia sp.]
MLPPRQLPPATRTFLGRDTELAKLSGILDSETGPAVAAPVVVAISGRAGVGKTALALAWAHSVADRFHDGQLYANLGALDGDSPASTSEVLGQFLRAFGLGGPAVPATIDERAAAFRSLVAGRRPLIMLDDAREAEQIRLLIPGGPAHVVVTSRKALAGIVAHDGATPLTLDPLPLGESLMLLRELMGARVDAATDAAIRLARSCRGLPLTLRIAAELSFVQPEAPLDALAGQLTKLRDGLHSQHSDTDSRSIFRSLFDCPYWHLDRMATQAFLLADGVN